MNMDEFFRVFNDTFNEIESIRITKGVEYANSDDQLANFKRLGAQLGLEPEAVLWVYLTKHLDSIQHHIKGFTKATTTPLSEPIEGRINDVILYSILLKALLQERTLRGRSGLQESNARVVAGQEVSDAAARGSELGGCTGLEFLGAHGGRVDRSEVPDKRVEGYSTGDVHPTAEKIPGGKR